MSVCTPALPACLLTCSPARLPAWLSACMPVCVQERQLLLRQVLHALKHMSRQKRLLQSPMDAISAFLKQEAQRAGCEWQLPFHLLQSCFVQVCPPMHLDASVY